MTTEDSWNVYFLQNVLHGNRVALGAGIVVGPGYLTQASERVLSTGVESSTWLQIAMYCFGLIHGGHVRV